MTWNFNMDEAPRGRVETFERRIGKNDVTLSQHVSPNIIAADASGTVVTLSRWLPKEERWLMFTKESPPVAWQPWPDHPRPA